MANAPNVAVRLSAQDDFTASFIAFNKGIEAVRKNVTAAQKAMATTGGGISGGGSGSGSDGLLAGIMGRAQAAQGRLRSALGSVAGAVPGGSAVLGLGTVAGIGAAVTSFAQFGTSLENTSKAAGMSAAGLNSMRGAARMAGLSAESAENAMTGLNQAVQGAVYGKNPLAASWFHHLGIDIGNMRDGAKPLETIIPKVADALKSLYAVNPSAALTLGGIFGQDGQGVALLAKGSAELEGLRQKAAALSSVTDAGQANAAKYAQSIGALTTASEGLRNSVVNSLTPSLVPLMTGLSGWIEKNSKTEEGLRKIDFAAAALTGTALFRMLFGANATAAIASKLLLTPPGAIVTGGLAAGALAGSMNAPMSDDFGRQLGTWGGRDNNNPASIDLANPFGGKVSGFFHRIFGGGGGGGGGAPVGANPADANMPADRFARAKTIHDEFVRQGSDDVRAWGYAANAMHENGGRMGGTPGDGGRSTGMFQWNGTRRQAFINMFGHDPSQGTMQEGVRFKLFEAREGEEKGHQNQVNAARTPGEAAAAISEFDIRPLDKIGERTARAATAEALAARAAREVASPPPRPAAPEARPEEPDPTRGGRVPAPAAPAVPTGSVTINIHHRNAPADVRMDAQADGTVAAIGEIRTTHAMPVGRGY